MALSKPIRVKPDNPTKSTKRGLKLRLQWVPAHQYARLATRKQWYSPSAEEKQLRLRSTVLRVGREAILRISEAAFHRQEFGKQLRKLDKALPKNHMVKVYKNMTYEDARILVRLRTGHSGLNSHLYKIGRTESAGCVL